MSVSTKIMAASSLTYMRRTSLYNNTQQHSRRSGWGTYNSSSSAHECDVVLYNNATHAVPEREREGEK